jgi:hypothetical protein
VAIVKFLLQSFGQLGIASYGRMNVARTLGLLPLPQSSARASSASQTLAFVSS